MPSLPDNPGHFELGDYLAPEDELYAAELLAVYPHLDNALRAIFETTEDTELRWSMMHVLERGTVELVLKARNTLASERISDWVSQETIDAKKSRYRQRIVNNSVTSKGKDQRFGDTMKLISASTLGLSALALFNREPELAVGLATLGVVAYGMGETLKD